MFLLVYHISLVSFLKSKAKYIFIVQWRAVWRQGYLSPRVEYLRIASPLRTIYPLIIGHIEITAWNDTVNNTVCLFNFPAWMRNNIKDYGVRLFSAWKPRILYNFIGFNYVIQRRNETRTINRHQRRVPWNYLPTENSSIEGQNYRRGQNSVRGRYFRSHRDQIASETW